MELWGLELWGQTFKIRLTVVLGGLWSTESLAEESKGVNGVFYPHRRGRDYEKGDFCQFGSSDTYDTRARDFWSTNHTGGTAGHPRGAQSPCNARNFEGLTPTRGELGVQR